MSSEPVSPWQVVDAGWGRAAVEFATLSELGNCREYVAMHQRLGVGPGDRLLDIACGAGLAVELAALRGAECAGIDASDRLVAVARDRNPGHDVRVGDMLALPWAAGSFEVVTSFRGIWGTTPDALDEVRRVLVPGGRLGLRRPRRALGASRRPGAGEACSSNGASWTSSGSTSRSSGSSPIRPPTPAP